MAASRFGIPALVHEECLTGFAAWQATAFPAPLSWGASFDPDLVEQMAALIGRAMRAVGVHQGLAPVLDVTRDYRWGRTEETIGEDPYLVGTVGTAYVRGLERSGIVATLKHFAGYAASAGRTQSRSGVDRSAGARRRGAAAVRDGRPRRWCPVGDEFLQRARRDPVRGRSGAAHRPAPGHLGIHRHRRRRLLRDQVPAVAARCRRRRGAGRRTCAGRRDRRRTADRALLRRAAARRRPAGSGRRGSGRSGASPGARAEDRTRTAGPGLVGTARRRRCGRPERRRIPCGRPAAGAGIGGAAGESRRDPAAAPRHPGSPWSGRWPTIRWPCSAAIRSRRMSGVQHPEIPIGLEIPTVLGALRRAGRGVGRHARPRLRRRRERRGNRHGAGCGRHRRGRRCGRRCRCLRGGRRRPRRAVRPRYLRRGLRRDRACPAGGSGRTGARGRRLRDAGGAVADDRPAVCGR